MPDTIWKVSPDGAYSDDENTDIRNARHEIDDEKVPAIYVNNAPTRQRFSFQLDDEVTLNTGGAEKMELGMNTSAISDSDAPDMNETGMFVDED